MPFAANDDVRIHYEVVGDGDPLMLYLGLTGSGERWRDTGYVAGLANDFRLILVDARGHGQSDKPHDPAAYGRLRQAADVIAVLDDLGFDAVRFWGHSMGGDIALTLGRHHPERVTALIVTGYSPFAAEGDEAAEMAAWADDLRDGMPGFVAGYERRHGPLPEVARARWLQNDGAATGRPPAAASVALAARSVATESTRIPSPDHPVRRRPPGRTVPRPRPRRPRRPHPRPAMQDPPRALGDRGSPGTRPAPAPQPTSEDHPLAASGVEAARGLSPCPLTPVPHLPRSASVQIVAWPHASHPLQNMGLEGR